MIFSYTTVALICVSYICLLFMIAFFTERGVISNRLVSHPVTYIFSLGIFASAWSFYGVIDLAHQYGYSALAYYLGTGALFLFGSLALKPLVALAQRFQITSMADMLVFRYNSHTVGGLVTFVMLSSMATMLALQLQAVADTVHILTHERESISQEQSSVFSARQSFAFIYCVMIALFALLYGSNREHHKGLVTAMAFESLVKMFGLVTVGLFVVFQLFHGTEGLELWLQQNPKYLEDLRSKPSMESTHALVLVFIATVVAMPHIFHMTVVENKVKESIAIVSWAFPLFLLIMALPVFPILWAGYALELGELTQYYPLTVALAAENTSVSIIAFVGGLSAATGALVAIVLSLSTMILNHWILPYMRFKAKRDVYKQIVWLRRLLIIGLVLFGYIFYLLLSGRFSLTQLAFPSFIAALQLFPGILGINHWTRGNRKAFICGLAVGWLIWLLGLFIPMLIEVERVLINYIDVTINVGYQAWEEITLISLGFNSLVFIAVSLLTKQSEEERYSAELCCQDELSHPVRMTLDVRSPDEIITRLATRLGNTTAKIEVDKTLQRLQFSANESRPYALRRIRDEIEANLSNLMGISMAGEIINSLIPFKVPERQGATDINLIENRLNRMRNDLTGLAAELNNLRMYHRRTLEELPLATCSIGQDMEVLLWNSAMERLTHICADEVTGSHVHNIAQPWGDVLQKFSRDSDTKLYKYPIDLNQQSHWITLHKATVPSIIAHQVDAQVILIEDVTELQMLEQELIHSERLASVGRLAAGVAHEIGNPITGIDCLAQNLRYETADPDINETAKQILSQTQRVTRIVQSLVSFSHSGRHSDEYITLNIRTCVQEAINLLSLQIEKHPVEFKNKIDAGIQLRGDSQQLIQVFINLLSNSRDASPIYAEIIVDAQEVSEKVIVTVTDFGSGIDAKHKDRIFEPFFTTKEPGEGTGLGLAMVYSIVEDHMGTVEIESPCHPDTQNGTRFVITLPKGVARN